jgi:hypothetical protein
LESASSRGRGAGPCGGWPLRLGNSGLLPGRIRLAASGLSRPSPSGSPLRVQAFRLGSGGWILVPSAAGTARAGWGRRRSSRGAGPVSAVFTSPWGGCGGRLGRGRGREAMRRSGGRDMSRSGGSQGPFAGHSPGGGAPGDGQIDHGTEAEASAPHTLGRTRGPSQRGVDPVSILVMPSVDRSSLWAGGRPSVRGGGRGHLLLRQVPGGQVSG